MSQSKESPEFNVERHSALNLPPNYSMRIVERTSRQLTFLGQCVLFLGVVALVIFAISELAARDTMLTLLSSRASALKSDFVERTKASEPAAQAASMVFDQERRLALKNIEAVEDLKRSIQFLSALGVESWDGSLRAIQGSFIKQNPAVLNGEAKSSPTSAPLFSLERLTDISVLPLLLYSSDQLLAIVVLGCGAIGAMISSLRADRSLSLRAFILGLASGFVTYLVLKGGKHIFLLQAQGEIVAFNPYGSAFAGLLAGLFTEKAHQLLSFLVDDFANRIRAASNNTSSASESASPVERKKTDA